jgi:hypothetical protein
LRDREALPPSSSKRLSAGAQPDGQAYPCRQEAQSHHSVVNEVRCAQDLQLLPPPFGRRDGGGDLGQLRAPCKHHLFLPQLERRRAPSYKEILLCQSDSGHQGRLCLWLPVKDKDATRKLDPSKKGWQWQVVKSKHPHPYTTPQDVSEARQ